MNNIDLKRLRTDNARLRTLRCANEGNFLSFICLFTAVIFNTAHMAWHLKWNWSFVATDLGKIKMAAKDALDELKSFKKDMRKFAEEIFEEFKQMKRTTMSSSKVPQLSFVNFVGQFTCDLS